MTSDASETAADVASAPDNEAVTYLAPRGGAYTVRPSSMRSYPKWSAEAKAWFRKTAANIRKADALVKQRSTVRTIAELNPTVAAREAALRKWASANAGCWRRDGKAARLAVVPVAPGMVTTPAPVTTPRATVTTPPTIRAVTTPDRKLASGLTIPLNRRTIRGATRLVLERKAA